MTVEEAYAKADAIIGLIKGDKAQRDKLALHIMSGETGEAPEKPADAATPATPEMPMAEKPAVPAVLAARINPPRPATPAQATTLAELWQRAKANTTPEVGAPTGTQSYGERFDSVEARLSRLEASHDELMISDLERQGLLVNIADPRKLYREAPAYFMEQVAKATPLNNPSPAAAAKPSGLRAIAKNVGLSEEDKFALDVKAYREAQTKLGRKIDQQTAIEEVEAAQKQAARAK